MTIEELKADIKWWESKRIIFNISLGLIGVSTLSLGIINSRYSFLFFDLFGILFWGIMANIAYSSGVFLELIDWYYFKNKIQIKRFRMFFFICGFAFSCFLTLIFGLIYFTRPL
ncbi:hypothetical protein [Aureivirga sp. CE67]|uniref:hypothetical protein n=1 Tax=Aureivirga sp. CE67 TaxID=1788983 RepID=UPI0018CAFBB4|nr:hypothetical protein [Aureivirga sp. CE67]